MTVDGTSGAALHKGRGIRFLLLLCGFLYFLTSGGHFSSTDAAAVQAVGLSIE